MGRDKLALALDGVPLLRRAVEPFVSTVSEVIVVTPPQGPACPLPPSVRIVHNLSDEQDMASSWVAGVRAAAPQAQVLALSLGDLPGLTASIVSDLLTRFEASPLPLGVPTWQRKRGHPVLVRAALREDLLKITGDRGARDLLATRAQEVCWLPVDTPACVRDLDTPQDLSNWRTP